MSAVKTEFTVRELAQQLGDFDREEEWFLWPPDLFVLTSQLLRTTGIYSSLLDVAFGEKDKELERYRNASRRLKRLSRCSTHDLIAAWHAWIVGKGDKPKLVDRLQAQLFDSKPITQNDQQLRPTVGWNIDTKLIFAIHACHALADLACRGFGLMSAPRGDEALLRYVANYHLTFSGSCSRLPRWVGVVLPKTRTPQKGLSPRSFSHHLTFHPTEVQVRWRAIPWINLDETENTVHIVAVPAPYEIKSDSFRPVPNPDTQGDYNGFSYFEYQPKAPYNVERIIEVLDKAYREVRTVHMIVFPELALSTEELGSVKLHLSMYYPEHQMPLIIAGVHTDSDGRSVNKVTLSAFFAGKWYDLGQHKHHRWKLDADQIRQYSLEGVLNPHRLWWEQIRLSPRALTFVAPNGWLAICPLICEDLAQMEPISDLIRGVGPTLVTAILMDGPQLPSRWSSRYVGVLADDPGSSILTVTSAGMARRSKGKGFSPSSDIAMWRDQERGVESVGLSKEAEAVLLTVKATWREEFTADTRSDDSNSAVLVLQSHRELDAKLSDRRHHEQSDVYSVQFSNIEDTEELTVLCFLVDCIIDAPGDGASAIFDATLEKLKHKHPVNVGPTGLSGPLADLWEHTSSIIQRRYSPDVPYRTSEVIWPRPEFEGAARYIKELYKRASAALPPSPGVDGSGRTDRGAGYGALVDYWGKLGYLAVDTFPTKCFRQEGAREYMLAFELVLWALHNRFTDMKRKLLAHRTPGNEALYATCREKLRELEKLTGSTGYANLPEKVKEVYERWRGEGAKLVGGDGAGGSTAPGTRP